MQYQSHADEQDCVSEVRTIAKATSNTYPIKVLTRRFNFALDYYYDLAFLNSMGWRFDDVNQSSEAIETLDLVSGTNKYKLSNLTSDLLRVFRIEFLDSASNGVLGVPERLEQLSSSFTETYKTTVQGIPSRYLKYGDFLFVRATPNYNKTAGVKFFFDRPASRMVYTDTTKVPPVPIIHLPFICKLSALPYLRENKKQDYLALRTEIAEDKVSIEEHFSKRDQDSGPAILRSKRTRGPR